MRNKSFGEKKLSFLDIIISFLRFYKIKKYIYNCDILADIGCGYEMSFLKWSNSEFNIKNFIGIDLSINKNIAKKQGFDFRINNLNQKIDLPDNSADIITSLAVLEHLDNPLKNLKEIHRILKFNGRFILTTPSPASKPILEFLAYKLKLINAAEIKDHKAYYNKKAISRLLLSVGFKKVNIKISYFMSGFNICVVCSK
ncbi:class I SAM-dependent methyltransferase [Candidatus Parcubacteria bacterium]|nr:class I SAM-dependent methyltransferase [Candidatus Parcubacteria bacterium]